jgi:hypothetical protein
MLPRGKRLSAEFTKVGIGKDIYAAKSFSYQAIETCRRLCSDAGQQERGPAHALLVQLAIWTEEWNEEKREKQIP